MGFKLTNVFLASIICLPATLTLGLLSSSEATNDLLVLTPISVASVGEPCSDQFEGGYRVHVKFENRGSNEVRVVGFASQCICVRRLFPLPETIAPGSVATFETHLSSVPSEEGESVVFYIEHMGDLDERIVRFVR